MLLLVLMRKWPICGRYLQLLLENLSMSEIVTLNFFANSYKFGRLSAVSQPHLHHLYAVDSCGMVS